MKDTTLQDLFETIRSIVKTKKVKNQTDLCEELKKAGIEVSQSSLSRKIEKMPDLIKKEGRYDLLEDKRNDLQIISIPPNIILIKYKPGYGMFLAQALDEAQIEGIAGTIAGDDTILIAVLKPIFIPSVEKKVKALLTETLSV